MSIIKGNPMYGSNKFDAKMAEGTYAGGTDGGDFDFGRLPLVSVTTGAADIVSVHQYDDGLKLYVSSEGANTIGNQPLQVAAGMNYMYDDANNEGIQWSLANSLNKTHIDSGPGIERYKIGSAAFYAELEFSITDISAQDDTFFGFRKLQAPQVIDDYTDVASLCFITSANPGLIQIATALNNAAMTETNTTDTLADDTAGTFSVYVSSAGVVTYKIDGSAPSTTAAFTFDDGDYVTPFFAHLATAATSGVIMRRFRHGRQ